MNSNALAPSSRRRCGTAGSTFCRKMAPPLVKLRTLSGSHKTLLDLATKKRVHNTLLTIRFSHYVVKQHIRRARLCWTAKTQTQNRRNSYAVSSLCAAPSWLLSSRKTYTLIFIWTRSKVLVLAWRYIKSSCLQRCLKPIDEPFLILTTLTVYTLLRELSYSFTFTTWNRYDLHYVFYPRYFTWYSCWLLYSSEWSGAVIKKPIDEPLKPNSNYNTVRSTYCPTPHQWQNTRLNLDAKDSVWALPDNDISKNKRSQSCMRTSSKPVSKLNVCCYVLKAAQGGGGGVR